MYLLLMVCSAVGYGAYMGFSDWTLGICLFGCGIVERWDVRTRFFG